MKVSLAYVFIAATTIVTVVSSEINPRHRFLKAKASKVSKATSKSKSSKSDTVDLCADKECLNNGCIVNTCNPNTGTCEGVPDVTLCGQPPDSQCGEVVCEEDGSCRIDDIVGSCDFEPGNLCKTGRCQEGQCVEGTVKDCFTPDCIGTCIESTGNCEYPADSCDPGPNACAENPAGTCDASGSCQAIPFSLPCPRGPVLGANCQRGICDPVKGCKADDNTNNGGLCDSICCNGECCPGGQVFCLPPQDAGGVFSCGGS